VCVAIVLRAPAAAAQALTATTGAVNGIVTDTSRAAVPGVAVRLSGQAVMAAETTTTDQDGAYRFSAVPPGDYSLTFELTGFRTVIRNGIRVSLAFTATVNTELSPGPVSESVTVAGSPLVDLASTAVTTPFDSQKLADLPGARDIFAILSNTPGVAMTKVDVGGNLALTLQDYTAYGLRAITGMNRNEVEGIRVGGANGLNDNYISDYASFAEIVVKAVGHSAAMPAPGTLIQYVGKSGGDAFHGNLYADFQGDSVEGANIDDAQIASGLTGGPGEDVHDVNRLQRLHDFTADAGGYLKKHTAWWYGAYRSSTIAQRRPWLIDGTTSIAAEVVTGKATYNLPRGQKLIGYVQHENAKSDNFNALATQPILTSDALSTNLFPVTVWKAEYNAALSDALFVDVRGGSYVSDSITKPKSTAPRIADAGANTVSGGSLSTDRQISRPQVNGAVTFTKNGPFGSHTVKVGGEYMIDHLVAPNYGYGNACDCLSTLNNGVPAQVQIQLGANVSKDDIATSAGFVDDTWRVTPRVTLSLGLRLDRYQPSLPAQQGPAGQTFAAIDPVLTFNDWGPRLGVSADLTGDGKTVLKVHAGRSWLYPGTNFAATFNPNPSGWSRTYLWTNDANQNGRWDPGEEGRLISLSGGSASTELDHAIVNTNVYQSSVYLEREVAADMGLRTGVVLNALRQPYGTINVNRPLSAYAVPLAIQDPGPDGRIGSGDDGAVLTAHNLTAAALAAPIVNLTTTLPGGNSDYYTWEISMTKRRSGRWSLLASFTETWSQEAALGAGADFTPNALINSVGGRNRFTTWQAKANGTVALPWAVLLVPVVRHQSGTPFARTFVQPLNYGSATIKAEPLDANRTPDLTLVDLRSEKGFRVQRARVTGFVDVYNLFNTNAVQSLTTVSGSSWLRPTAITGPRILRVGARVDW